MIISWTYGTTDQNDFGMTIWAWSGSSPTTPYHPKSMGKYW